MISVAIIAVTAVIPTRSAYSDDNIKLGHPGRLFDHQLGKSTKCNALVPGRVNTSTFIPDEHPPVMALNDSKSIGQSAMWDQVQPWVQGVVTLSALYDTMGDRHSGDVALEALKAWAEANAIMATPTDQRYKGQGNAGSYKPSAAAPVLDMENAAQLGYAVLYAMEMLGDLPSADDHRLVEDWAMRIVVKYGAPIGDTIFSSRPTGIWRLDDRAMLAKAIIDGNQNAYATAVNAYYRLFRQKVSKSGAILKNANRGDRALHYQSMGILSMTAIFDMVENQGGTVPSDIVEKLHGAVRFFLDADRDNKVILPFAKEGYNNPGRGDKQVRVYRESAEHYWWMIYYLSRFPNNENAKRLRAFLSKNDQYQNVARVVMSSQWVPYPINCYQPFDMSPASVSSANAYVQQNYPPLAAVPNNRSRGFGAPHPAGAKALAIQSSIIRKSTHRSNFISYKVYLNAKMDGKRLFVPGFGVYADFTGNADNPDDLQLLRIVVARYVLDKDSQKKNYLGCGEVAAEKDGDDQVIKLHIGEEERSNSCLLSKMSAPDRTKWASVLASFGTILNSTAVPAPPEVDYLKKLYAEMTH